MLDGKLLHEKAYKRANEKKLMISDEFKIDVLDGEYVREVKLSSKMTKADRYQLLYYLYQLKKRGLIRKGLVSYTKEKKTEEIILTKEDENELEKIEVHIKKILNSPTPPKLIKKKYCRSCAYYDFCFTTELEEE